MPWKRRSGAKTPLNLSIKCVSACCKHTGASCYSVLSLQEGGYCMRIGYGKPYTVPHTFTSLQELYGIAASFSHHHFIPTSGADIETPPDLLHQYMLNPPRPIQQQWLNSKGVSRMGLTKLFQSNLCSYCDAVPDIEAAVDSLFDAWNIVDGGCLDQDAFAALVQSVCNDYHSLFFEQPVLPSQSSNCSPLSSPRRKVDLGASRTLPSSSFVSLSSTRDSSCEVPFNMSHNTSLRSISKKERDVMNRVRRQNAVEEGKREKLVESLRNWQMYYCGGSAPGLDLKHVICLLETCNM